MKLFMKKACAIMLTGSLLLGSTAIEPFSSAFIPALTASAAQTSYTYTENGVTFTYTVSNRIATITRIDLANTCSNSFYLYVPSMLNGYPVRRIVKRAVKNNGAKIVSLTIPRNVLYIEDYAFDSKTCKNLKSVTLHDSIQKIETSTFGETQTITSAYVMCSDGKKLTINRSAIENIAGNLTLTGKNNDMDRFYTCTSSGTLQADPMTVIINSLSNSPLVNNICKSKALSIIHSLTPSNATEVEKMQAIYNYVVTTVRYSKITYSSGEPYVGLNQRPVGTFFFNSGVCAGMAQAVLYLSEAAKLDVKYISTSSHAWNLFKPSDKTKYYIVDTTACKFCIGGGATTSQTYNGVTYPLAETFLGNTILVKVMNNSSRKFNVYLADRNKPTYPYCSYSASSPDDNQILSCAQLKKNKEKKLYMYSNAYYNFMIRDEDGTKLFCWEYALNNLTSPKTIKFKDKTGATHTCKISINKTDPDLISKTNNNSAFVIEID